MDKAWVKQESDQRHCLVQTLDKSEKIYCFLPPHAAPLQSFQQNNALKTCSKTLKRTKFRVQWRFVQLHWTFWFVNVFLNKNVEAHSKLMISFIIEVGRRNQIKQLHCLYFIFLYILVFVFVPDLYFVFCLSIFVFLNLKVAH